MNKDIQFLPDYYRNYVNQVPEEKLLHALINNGSKQGEFFKNLPEKNGDYRYAEGKWTVKQVMSHIIDTERIMSYRALRFSRNDQSPLPGFEENDYAQASNASNRRVAQLTDEFIRLRASTVDLFESFSDEMLKRTGEANGQKISVDAIGFIIAGHAIHHINVLKDHYHL
ncbi:MAG: DinB family protein [Candidatus Cyclobacteriaceae bacterium M2_1C_046]